ncbi:hypothetical protein O6P43_019187 [Quillaja saponaria]|uniref:Uncharacterized protein n=1 Tax=Quillaja saponaria TaxID=32244 RepID=A0AAD7LHY4_QUISA|nr:hypothetical protein O6P43_019187 [Quillaja saponaria]
MSPVRVVPQFLDQQQHTAASEAYHQMHEKQQGHHQLSKFLLKENPRLQSLTWKLELPTSLALSIASLYNGERATVIVTAMDPRRSAFHSGCSNCSSRLRFGVLDLQVGH